MKPNKYTLNFVNNNITGADSILAVLGGRYFYKKYNDAALVGLIYDGTYTGPVLVGTTANSVAYYTSLDSTLFTYSGTFVSNGVTYYYSSVEYWMAGNLSDTSGLERTKYTNTTIVIIIIGIM